MQTPPRLVSSLRPPRCPVRPARPTHFPLALCTQQRFKKHSNLVESNKQNVQKGERVEKRVVGASGVGKERGEQFEPRREEQIRCGVSLNQAPPQPAHHQSHITPESLGVVLRKRHMRSQRNLLGYNIPLLERRFNFSRFELHSLYSIYHTLLLDSGLSLAKFRAGFEVMLNMNKITIRAEVLERIFREQRAVDFPHFVEMYSRIDQLIFRQNIVDYVEILFEGIYDKDNIRFEDIVRIMRNRITEKEAVDVAKTIYQQYELPFDRALSLRQLTQLCHQCDNFAKKMYRLYTRQLKEQ